MLVEYHDDFVRFDELILFAFLFLGDVAEISGIPVFDYVAVGIGRQLGKLIFQVADLGQTERVISGSDDDHLSPVVFF